MKCFSTVSRIIAVFLSVVVLGRAQGTAEDRFAGVAAKDRMAWKLAVNTATRRMMDAAEGVKTPDAEQMALLKSALTDAMAGDLAAHQKRDVSRGICLENAGFILKQIFNDRLELILKVANEQSAVPVVTADLTEAKAAGETMDTVLKASLGEFERVHFDALFEAVRTTVVERERQSLASGLTAPSFETIDAVLVQLAGADGMLAWPWTEAVTNGLQLALNGEAEKQPLHRLEELESYTRDMANKGIESIRQQIEWQRKIVDQEVARVEATQPIVATSMERQLFDALSAAIESSNVNKENDLSRSFPVFSCTQARIRSMALGREAERLAGFLRSTPLLTVEPAWLSETLRADLSVHRQYDKSRQLLLDALVTNRRSFLFGSYADNLPPAESARLNRRLEDEPDLADIIRRRLAERVDALLPGIRADLAQSQYNENFGHLTSLAVLPDVLVAEVHSTGGALPSTVPAALAFLQQGGILMPDLPDVLLEECQTMVLQRVHGLVAEAHVAVTRQLALVKQIESSQQAKIRSDMASGAVQDAILKDWHSLFQERWDAALAEAPTAYSQMTVPARDAINISFFRMYEVALHEQMNALESGLAEQAQSVPATVSQDSPLVGEEAQIAALLQSATPVDAGDPMPSAEDDKEQMPDLLLVLSGEQADRCDVALRIPAFENAWVFTVDLTDADAAAASIFLQMRPQMEELARYAHSRWLDRPRRLGRRGNSKLPEISIHLQVESPEVRHRTIVLLQRYLEAELGTRGSQLVAPTEFALTFEVLL